MVQKRDSFQQVNELRKRGFSYTEISKITGIPKSTLSTWLSSTPWSSAITARNRERAAHENGKRISLLNRARSNQNKKLYTEALRTAGTEYKHYKLSPLFIAGLMLYVSQGDKTHPSVIRLSSSKLEAHAIFINFSVEYLGVSRENIRFLPLLYPSLSPTEMLASWAAQIHIPPSQFYKYQVIQRKKGKSALHSGVGNTIIGSAVLKKKLMKWIELSLQELT